MSYSAVTESNPSISFDPGVHPLGNLLKVATNQSLSVEARLLYVILVMMAWSKGRCWPSQQYQSEALGRSDRQVRRYHQELERAGILGINRRPGQSSFYYPWLLHQTPDTCDLRAQDTGVRVTLKKEQVQNVKNVIPPHPKPPCSEKLSSANEDNVNAIEAYSKAEEFRLDKMSISESEPSQDVHSRSQEPPPASTPVRPKGPSGSKPPLTQDHMFLVEEIERVTGDTWSRGYFVNLVRQVDEQTIWAALSVTREKMALESGVNGGAYFSSTVRGMAGLHSLTPHRPSPVTSNEFDVGPLDSNQPSKVSIPKPEPVDEIDPTALVKGWKVMYRPGNVSSVLSQVGRCLPSWDAQSTWESLRQDRVGECEETVLDEFLDLCAVKVQFQSKAVSSGGEAL